MDKIFANDLDLILNTILKKGGNIPYRELSDSLNQKLKGEIIFDKLLVHLDEEKYIIYNPTTGNGGHVSMTALGESFTKNDGFTGQLNSTRNKRIGKLALNGILILFGACGLILGYEQLKSPKNNRSTSQDSSNVAKQDTAKNATKQDTMNHSHESQTHKKPKAKVNTPTDTLK